MVTKKFAIPKKNTNIALKYGSNVSQGIAEMERRLERYRGFTKGMRFSGEIE